MEKEIWKDVPNYEGLYQVSNLGRVKSFERIVKCKNNVIRVKKEKITYGYLNEYGYKFVILYFKNKRKTMKIHKLVAMTFLGHKPCGHKLIVDHINNDKTDNRVYNLQLITQRENTSKDRKGYSSKYVGVSWSKQMKKWRSQISFSGKVIHLGYFNNEIDAHNTYQKALRKI